MENGIITHNNNSFHHNYVRRSSVDPLLERDFSNFFIVRYEDLLPVLQIPFPPVRATNHNIIFLTKGEIVVSSGSHTYKIKTNQCIYVPEGQVFSVEKADLQHTQGYLCNFHNDFLGNEFTNINTFRIYNSRAWDNPKIQLDEGTGLFVKMLLERLLWHYNDSGMMQLAILQAIFAVLLVEIVCIPEVSTGHGTYPQLISKRFKDLLYKNARTNHSVADYANFLNVTPNHLNKTITMVTGKSPVKWINDIVMMEAKVLLQRTTLSINEVASQVGYSDASYFSRMFKKCTSVSPMAFRKMIEKS